MIVPQYWAEGRLRERVGRRYATVRRFGWSDVSEADAQRHADERTAEAMARLRAGVAVPRYERKLVYGGAAGLPIREEVLARVGSVVLTRNGYGAVCLNTPDVLFADIDFAPNMPACLVPCVIGLLVLVAGGAAVAGRWQIVAGLAGVAVVVAAVGWLAHWWQQRGDRPATAARERIDRFAAAHPDWRLRVYRTPAGLRVLALHRTFDPQSPEVVDCFRELGTDPVYARMCQLQGCFRARLGPKPWRVGIDRHIRPRRGAWPISADHLPERAAWVAEYDRAAAGFAACRFLFEAGEGPINPTAEAVRRLHDERCRAETDLPLG